MSLAVRSIVLCASLLAAAVHTASGPDRHDAAHAPTIGVDGSALTVGGKPQFVLMVSYFDALDAAHLDEDLAWIRERADGIRIFATWWDFDETRRCATRYADDTLIRVGPDGAASVAPDRLKRLQSVIAAARAARLVVDLTFSYDTVRGISRLEGDADGVVCGSSSSIRNQVRLDAWSPAVAEVARALAGPDADHVFFDLQNEVSGGWTRLSPDDVSALARAVKKAAPNRLVTASNFSPDAKQQVDLVRRAGLDLLTFHDWPRDKGWPERTAAAVTRLRDALRSASLNMPILAGEPPYRTYDRGPSAFDTALQQAQTAGAAGWTLHTHAGFRLDGARFADQLTPDARSFLDRQRTARRNAGAGH